MTKQSQEKSNGKAGKDLKPPPGEMKQSQGQDSQGAVEGEGSYTGTRRYNEHVKEHIATQNTEELAEKAKQALEGDEREELEEAERRAKRGPKPASSD